MVVLRGIRLRCSWAFLPNVSLVPAVVSRLSSEVYTLRGLEHITGSLLFQRSATVAGGQGGGRGVHAGGDGGGWHLVQAEAKEEVQVDGASACAAAAATALAPAPVAAGVSRFRGCLHG